LYVAIEDPSNQEALDEVADYSGLPVRPMIAPASDIRAAIRAYYLGLLPEPTPEPPILSEPPPRPPSGSRAPTPPSIAARKVPSVPAPHAPRSAPKEPAESPPQAKQMPESEQLPEAKQGDSEVAPESEDIA